MVDEGRLICSFCGKTEKDVRSLISAPGVLICDECVMLCVDILVDRALPSKVKPMVEP